MRPRLHRSPKRPRRRPSRLHRIHLRWCPRRRRSNRRAIGKSLRPRPNRRRPRRTVHWRMFSCRRRRFMRSETFVLASRPKAGSRSHPWGRAPSDSSRRGSSLRPATCGKFRRRSKGRSRPMIAAAWCFCICRAQVKTRRRVGLEAMPRRFTSSSREASRFLRSS